MEKKKLVKQLEKEGDTRLKWVVLTDYARKMTPFLKNTEKRFASRILNGFSEEEKKTFLNYLNRIQDNLNNMNE